MRINVTPLKKKYHFNMLYAMPDIISSRGNGIYANADAHLKVELRKLSVFCLGAKSKNTI